MKRIVVSAVAILLFLGGLITGDGVYRVLTATDDDSPQRTGLAKVVWNGNQVTVHGKTASFDILDPENVEVSHSSMPEFIGDDRMLLKFQVTIKDENPLLITKEAYDRIYTGMNYERVGKALGGVMTKGKMSANFCGKIEIMQGAHMFELDFMDGTVCGKSAEGMIEEH